MVMVENVVEKIKALVEVRRELGVRALGAPLQKKARAQKILIVVKRGQTPPRGKICDKKIER